MRIPNSGQPLDERRIVREGKRIAEAMLAEYAERPAFSPASMAENLAAMGRRLLIGLKSSSRPFP